ncbi:MAG: 3-deoxy-7-phosphoheptulonate synthase [Planctomycetes bacterium]|nr:3-deoxy-7-phosphoheptulonate synthase [Planctomycetota bacterium]
MHWETDDLRIDQLKPLIPPAILMEEYPITDHASETVGQARQSIAECVRGRDDRLVVVVGPCSIHDEAAAIEYAQRLRDQAKRLADDLLIVMRVYFEKPRTTVGWKGLINDPDMDDSFHINQGLKIARCLLLSLAEQGLPAGCEFLDTIMPQFFADLVSWGAIGARTTESQVHRELASGMSCPMGFKNGTDGNLQVAVDAIKTACHPHRFLSVTKQSVAAIVATRGNKDCHVILRGGHSSANYDVDSVTTAAALLDSKGLHTRVMIDCSHGNSGKDPKQQPRVAHHVAEQLAQGLSAIFGVMLESHLVGGNQPIAASDAMTYGQSVTDACLNWDETVPVLDALADAVRQRRSF